MKTQILASITNNKVNWDSFWMFPNKIYSHSTKTMDKCNLSGQHRDSCAPQGVSYSYEHSNNFEPNPASSIWILACPCWTIIGWTEGISRWLDASANHITPLAHWLAERFNPLTHLHWSQWALPPAVLPELNLSKLSLGGTAFIGG